VVALAHVVRDGRQRSRQLIVRGREHDAEQLVPVAVHLPVDLDGHAVRPDGDRVVVLATGDLEVHRVIRAELALLHLEVGGARDLAHDHDEVGLAAQPHHHQLREELEGVREVLVQGGTGELGVVRPLRGVVIRRNDGEGNHNYSSER